MWTFGTGPQLPKTKEPTPSLYTNRGIYLLITPVIALVIFSKTQTKEITDELKFPLTSLMPSIKGLLLLLVDPISPLLPNLLN